MNEDTHAETAAAVAHLTGSRREMVGDYQKSAEAPVAPPERVYVSRPISAEHLAALREANPLIAAARAMQARMAAENEGAGA